MKALSYSLLSAALLGLAWWSPGSIVCALLGWSAAMLMIVMLKNSASPYLHSYAGGILTNALGFFWLRDTIAEFGGFSLPESLAIFALFVTLSALQYPLFVLFYRYMPAITERLALSAGLAWVFSELLSIRIFPWYLGHTQLALIPLAQIADLGGAPLISLTMFWVCEGIYRAALERSRRAALLPFALLAAAFAYGLLRIQQFTDPQGLRQDVALVQANITTVEKHNVKLFEANTERYAALTQKIKRNNLLVVWPEAVIQEFISAAVGNAAHDPRIPYWSDMQMPLLVGTLSFDSRDLFYNSAMAIYPDGTVPPPYHKMILMPFGEYTPLASIFPWIREIHPTPDFTPGKDVKVFEYPVKFDDGKSSLLKIAPLICYEDIVPELSRRAVNHGAELLVNLTNDAWFGKTIAPHQHNLIASFRAIENRRYLLRSTNSGLTAVITPLGQTVAQLAPFSDGVLTTTVILLNSRTFFSTDFGSWLWWAVAGLVVMMKAGEYLVTRRSIS